MMTTRAQLPASVPEGCRICVSLAASEVDRLKSLVATVVGADLIEVRLDALPAPLDCGESFFSELRALATAPVGFTCRPTWEGGGFAGSESDRRRLLESAAGSGAAFVDVEQDADWAEEFVAMSPAPVILSHHWSWPKPADLAERAERMLATAPAVAKLVAPAETPADAVPLLRTGADLVAEGQPAAAFCIGKAGAASRVLAVARGAALIYATQPGAEPVAEGQWSVQALLQDLRMPRWRNGFRCCALAGYPVEHSLSPTVFNAAFDEYEEPMGYVAISWEELDPVLELARAQNLRGLSITMPLKETAARRCTELDPLAEQIGAVNTLVWTGAGWRGYNTDAAAVRSALADVIDVEGRRVAIVGAGGAARAAAVALAAAGAELSFCNRTRGRAEDLARLTHGTVVDLANLQSEPHDVIINATPLGMGYGDGARATPFPADWLRGHEVVFDFVYRPRPTPLLRLARERGCVTVDGLEMFVRQAAQQYRLWVGDAAGDPLDIMRRAAEKALRGESSQENVAGGTPGG